MNAVTLYKFRTLDRFEFILDIIVNKRLYAATFESMNDPMEGFYTYGSDIPSEALAALESHKSSLRFCSLAKYSNNPLMWAHYADGNRGIAIGVELDESADLREVNYESQSNLIASVPTTLERAKNVLSCKASYWHYEEEIRVFAQTGNFIPVQVKEIIFGEKADDAQKALLKAIVQAIDPSIKLKDWTEDMYYCDVTPVYNLNVRQESHDV
ncbi:DUF2971 domain-containing protein [Vibrio vulnificus]|uniref:DUF2971 domain-containing protein n=1 Tax=Vibrio vulnificus TaxID=672 RepID=UPI00313447FE